MTRAFGLICWIFAFFLNVSAGFAAPAVGLTAVVGPPTTSLTVNGTGFGAFAAVDVYFDTSHLCLALADGGGLTTCRIKVPKDAQPQAHYITMLQRNTGTGAQAVFTVRTDWPQFHGRNAAHNGNNPYENTINAANVGNLDTLWTAPLGDGAESAPSVFAGRVFVTGGTDKKLHSFNSLTGAPNPGFPKQLAGGNMLPFSPAVGNGNVYIGTLAPDSKLYAFNVVTGSPVAGFPVSIVNSVQSSPTVALNKVYIVSAPVPGIASLRAFSAVNGAAVPGFPKALLSGSAGTPTVADGVVYVGDSSGKFHAFDADTGSTLSGSPRTVGGAIRSTAAVSASAVYVGSFDFKLYAFTKELGAVAGFPVLTGGTVIGSPAVGRGLVIVGSSDNKLYAFRTSTTGTPVWTTVLDNDVSGSPVIANDIVFASTATRLYALSISNGAILWSTPMFTNAFASPTVSDGVVYVSSDRRFHAFSVNGEPLSAQLRGGALGVKPALSSLRPDLSLKAR